MLKVVDCIEQVKTALANIFKNLGVLKAIGQLDSNKTYYLENFGSELSATSNSNYFIYDISLINLDYADDEAILKEAYIIVNLYTRKSPERKEIKDLVANLEDEFIKEGYRFNLSNSIYYDVDTKTWCLSYEARKALWELK